MDCTTVSVLFSEPKIPQYNHDWIREQTAHRFQCSSASRKFLNWRQFLPMAQVEIWSFSALQRAENSSIYRMKRSSVCLNKFQCSSASRKFLNLLVPLLVDSEHHVSVLFSEPKIPQSDCRRTTCRVWTGFSALQRAENSSMRNIGTAIFDTKRFQCSSASRKFLNQYPCALGCQLSAFQCSSASRKFLNVRARRCRLSASRPFQCSSASRKFLN